MLVRQESSKTRDEKVKNIEKGLNYAREAVQLDPQDGLSWTILGNAYLSSFFGIQQNPKILKQCLSAYTQAVSIIFFLIICYNILPNNIFKKDDLLVTNVIMILIL